MAILFALGLLLAFGEEGRKNSHKIRLLQVVLRRVRRARAQQEAEE
jgi:hypothetical protein